MSNGLYVEKLGAGFRRIMTETGTSLPLSILAYEDVKAYWILTVRLYETGGELVFDAGAKVGRYALKRITWRGSHDVVVHVNSSKCEDGSRVEKVVGVYLLNEGGLREYCTDPYVSGMLKRTAGQAMGLEVYFKESERSAIEATKTWDLADKERARREREDEARAQAEVDAVAHPHIGDTAGAKVLLGLLHKMGPATVDGVEPESSESGHRPGKKGGTKAKSRGEDASPRGNKHAGGKGNRRHPQMDDDVPVGARYH